MRRSGGGEDAVGRDVEEEGALGRQLLEARAEKDEQLAQRRLVQQILVRVVALQRSLAGRHRLLRPVIVSIKPCPSPFFIF